MTSCGFSVAAGVLHPARGAAASGAVFRGRAGGKAALAKTMVAVRLRKWLQLGEVQGFMLPTCCGTECHLGSAPRRFAAAGAGPESQASLSAGRCY